MANVGDLYDQAFTIAATLGYDTTSASAFGRPVRIENLGGSQLATVYIAATEEVVAGSNLILRIAEVEVTFASQALEGSQAAIRAVERNAAIDMQFATETDRWTALAAVRSSPTPEVEISRDLERVGRAVVFSVRARVALEA
jgi:hypothetical protein